MKFSIKTILRVLFVLSCMNLQAMNVSGPTPIARPPVNNQPALPQALLGAQFNAQIQQLFVQAQPNNLIAQANNRYWKRMSQIEWTSVAAGVLSTALVGPRFLLPALVAHVAIVAGYKLNKINFHPLYRNQAVYNPQNNNVIDRVQIAEIFYKNIAAFALFNATAGFVVASTARILANTFLR